MLTSVSKLRYIISLMLSRLKLRLDHCEDVCYMQRQVSTLNDILQTDKDIFYSHYISKLVLHLLQWPSKTISSYTICRKSVASKPMVSILQTLRLSSRGGLLSLKETMHDDFFGMTADIISTLWHKVHFCSSYLSEASVDVSNSLLIKKSPNRDSIRLEG